MYSLMVFFLCVLLLLLQIYLDIRSKKFDILNINYLFQVYYIIQLPLSSVFAELFGMIDLGKRINATPSYNARIETLNIIALSHIFYTFGVLLIRNYRLKSIIKLPSCWKKQRAKYLIPVLIVLGYLLFFILVNSYGGLLQFLLRIEEWRTQGIIGNAVFTTGIASLLPLAITMYIIENKSFLKNNRKFLKLASLFFIILLPISLLGYRSYVFQLICMVMLVYNYSVKKINTKYLIIVGLIFAVFFSFYSLLRSVGKLEDLVINNKTEFALKLLLRSRGSEIVGLMVDDINNNNREHNYGLEIFTTPISIIIPRKIWTEKPEPINMQICKTFFSRYGIDSGLSATCIGEFYWQLGLINTVICHFCLGIIITLIQNKLFASGNDTVLLIISSYFFPIIRITETPSGAFNSIMAVTSYLLLIVFFLNVNITNRLSVYKPQVQNVQ